MTASIRTPAPLSRADWMPRSIPTLRVGGRRELLRIATVMLAQAVKDLGANRVKAGGPILARNWVTFSTKVIELQGFFDYDPRVFPPTGDEAADWLARVSALRQILRQPMTMQPLERRLDQLLAQFQSLDWTDVTVWQRPFQAKRGY